MHGGLTARDVFILGVDTKRRHDYQISLEGGEGVAKEKQLQ